MRNIEDIFQDRTCYKFQSTPVEQEKLESIYNMMRLGPTSGNSCPVRLIFVSSAEKKAKLESCVIEANVAKVHSAPVVVLFAYDSAFYNKMDKLFPPMKSYFSSLAPNILDRVALQNSTLQAAYFMMIARAFGLACGPMSGFDSSKLEAEFLSGTSWKINFICNLGYRDGDNEYPRLERLSFDEACLMM